MAAQCLAQGGIAWDGQETVAGVFVSDPKPAGPKPVRWRGTRPTSLEVAGQAALSVRWRHPRHSRLDLPFEAEIGRLVLDVFLQVYLRVAGHRLPPFRCGDAKVTAMVQLLE